MSTDRTMAVSSHADLEALPTGSDSLLAAGARHSFFLSRHWFQLVVKHGMAPSDAARFLVVREHGEATALLALNVSRSRAFGLSTPYTCLFAPLLSRADAAPALLAALHPWSVLQLDALDPTADTTTALIAAAAASGHRARLYDHFGNWQEPVEGLSWSEYLAQRPGPLRSTVRRKLGRMARDGGRLDLIVDPVGLEPAIAAYEDVYARSWKQAEPFPDFNAALMRALASLGKLRLGVYRLDGTPVAAQIWLLEHGRATVLKLAHDGARRDASPGTVLTALMLHHLLDTENVREIDFGRGDDDYKKLWASVRRQMIGLLLVHPWRPAGLAALLRQDAGMMRRRFRALL